MLGYTDWFPVFIAWNYSIKEDFVKKKKTISFDPGLSYIFTIYDKPDLFTIILI